VEKDTIVVDDARGCYLSCGPRVAMASTARFPTDAELHEGVASALSAVKLYRYRHAALDARRAAASRSYFQLETALWSLLPAAVWTDDPHAADFFVVPHCLVANWIDRDEDKVLALKRYLDDALVPALGMIVHEQPFFNRSGGADHLFVYVMDTGPLASEEEGLRFELARRPLLRHAFSRMTKVGYYGTREADRTDLHLPSHRPSGWRYARDIAVPMFHDFHRRAAPDADARLFGPGARRRADIYFRGQTGNPQLVCSPGSRAWIGRYMAGCGPRCTATEGGMEAAWFALCPAGIGCWGTRAFDAIERLAIPVILSDGILLPYDSLLDWSGFSEKTRGHATRTAPHTRPHARRGGFAAAECAVYVTPLTTRLTAKRPGGGRIMWV
jgi:hypothetical protein